MFFLEVHGGEYNIIIISSHLFWAILFLYNIINREMLLQFLPITPIIELYICIYMYIYI